MILQNTQHVSSLTDTRSRTPRLLKINQQAQSLLARNHEVDHPLQHKYKMLDLPICALCILFLREEIQAWPRCIVVSQNQLFSSLILDPDILRGMFQDPILSTPCQCPEQPLLGISDVPFGSTKVPKEALAGQKEPFFVSNGSSGSIFCRGCRHSGPGRDSS